MTRTLILNSGHGDQDTTFVIQHKSRRITCALYRDYEKRGDGIYWAMQIAGCIKASYTDKDREESARLRTEEPVRHGDQVMILGQTYSVRVLGDYSNCAVFDLVE